MGQNELLHVVRNIKDLRLMKEELESEIAAAEDIIKAEMTARGVDELTVDIFKICWNKVASRRFDTASFKKAHEELYNFFTKTTETRRFSIA